MNKWNAELGVGLAIALLGSLSAQAQIFMNVTGGTGDSPMTINIDSGGIFTATESYTGTGGVVFVDFFDNTASSASHDPVFSTITLDGASSPSTTGTFLIGIIDLNDLILAYSDLDFSESDSLVLSSGTRITEALSLNYTTLNPTGNAYVMDGFGNNLTAEAVTWTAIPEPGEYVVLVAVGLVGFVSVRRRREAREFCYSHSRLGGQSLGN